MSIFPNKLQSKLLDRKAKNALRQLGAQNSLVDFSSNDYLGFSFSKDIFDRSHNYLIEHNLSQNGATGSRLLSGNHQLYTSVEKMLCDFHNVEAALVFNSGYDANVGLFSSVPQRGDIILYDESIHASIRDGIVMSNAKAFKFKHNDLGDLKQKCKTERRRNPIETEIYIVTESVFSMDGDSPDLETMATICKKHKAHFIVDEAHALGVFNTNGSGLIQKLGLENDVFARIITFGKGLGCHAATILGSNTLKQYLINFARSLIYTTALPPHTLATIKSAYGELVMLNQSETSHPAILQLAFNINFFKLELARLKLQRLFIESDSAIHCCIISGNDTVKSIASKLQEQGFDVKAILSPTVPIGQERLRFCLHSFNTKEDISNVLSILKETINKFPFPLERD